MTDRSATVLCRFETDIPRHRVGQNQSCKLHRMTHTPSRSAVTCRKGSMMSNLSTNDDNFSEKIANGSFTLVIQRKDTTLDILNNLSAVWSELLEHFREAHCEDPELALEDIDAAMWVLCVMKTNLNVAELELERRFSM
jgi:hypothetical protein